MWSIFELAFFSKAAKFRVVWIPETWVWGLGVGVFFSFFSQVFHLFLEIKAFFARCVIASQLKKKTKNRKPLTEHLYLTDIPWYNDSSDSSCALKILDKLAVIPPERSGRVVTFLFLLCWVSVVAAACANIGDFGLDNNVPTSKAQVLG